MRGEFSLKMILTLLLISVSFCGNQFVFAAETTSTESAQKAKLQLEDLLIWKIADELKLTPEAEKKISDVIKSINKKKHDTNQEIEKLTTEIIKSEDEKSKTKAFNELRKKLQQHGMIAVEELEQVKAAIGVKKLGQYLEVKNDISEKVKNLIVPADKKGGKKLPPPKVIEE